MKILQITKGYPPDKGGIETYTFNLASSLKKKFKISIIATHSPKPSYEKSNGIEIYRIKKLFEIFQVPFNLPYFNLIFKTNPDIIHFHIPNPISEIYLLFYSLFSKKSKILITYHADLPLYTKLSKISEFLRRFYIFPLLKKSDLIVSTSYEYARNSPILKHFLKKTKIIPIGISKEMKTERIEKIRKRFKISKKEKIVLFVGRLYPYKGLEFLIRSIPLVISKVKNVKFVIVGDGIERKKLEKLVKNLSIKKFVVFTGYLNEKEKNTFYKICDVFVLPSINRGEAFGISMVEAMKFSKPIVSTKIKGSGVNFVNKHMETGIVVEPKNPKELAKAIIKLLKNEQLRKKLGRNARRRFLKYFTLEKMVNQIEKIYLKLYQERELEKK
ncbi:MAG: hypothetical protein B6U78_02280 [Candidatus Aenigmarchaeota archaeon ex4484_224]|nr:MAG: hypothetical protein B6U78_02280 [Candidatus Aenigmarchaeota archaeon ex4484_224]